MSNRTRSLSGAKRVPPVTQKVNSELNEVAQPRGTTARKPIQVPKLNFKQDATTKNLVNLRKVSFERTRTREEDNLALRKGQERNGTQISQMVHTGAMGDEDSLHTKTKNFSSALLGKKQIANSKVAQIIEQSKVANLEVTKKNAAEFERELIEKDKERQKDPIMYSLMKAQYDEDDRKAKVDNKIADGFVRSNRNVAMRVRDNIDIEMTDLEETKVELVQRLNAALLKLDKVNAGNREVSEKLVEQIKFVRDLQKASSCGEDINEITSSQLKVEFSRLQRMNVQLKEELKRAESERLKILERFKSLSGEKEVVSITTNGMKKTYKVTTVGIGHLNSDIEHFKREMCATESAMCRTRDVIEQIMRDVEFLTAQNRPLVDETEFFKAKNCELTQRLDEASVCLEGERQRQLNMHRVHVKLLATRQLEESMQKILARNLESHLDMICLYVKSHHRQFGAVWKFKAVLEARNIVAQRRALQKWFAIACNPINVINLNKIIPEFYQKRHKGLRFFYRWQHEFLLRQTEKKHTRQVLLNLFNCQQKLQSRLVKGFFQRWRDNLIDKNQALKTLFRFFKKQANLLTSVAFEVWKTTKEIQDFDIRSHALVINVACKRSIAYFFHGWKLQIYAKKRYRVHLKMRAMKNWRVFIKRRKQFALQTLGLLSMQNQVGQYYKQLCFNALRGFKIRNRYEHVLALLKTGEEPKIAALNTQINEIATHQKYLAVKRSTTALANPFGRLIFRYFDHWKRESIRKTRQIKVEFSQFLVKLYQNKMNTAFSRWKNCKRHRILYIQAQTVQELQAGNQSLDQEIRKTVQIVKQRNDKQKNASSKRLKLLCVQAFQRNIKHFLYRWRSNAILKDNQQKGAETILNRLRRRRLRFAFSKYCRGVRVTNLERTSNRRILECKARLSLRTKKRIFNAVKNYSGNHHNATTYLRTVLNHIAHQNKMLAFQAWLSFKKQHFEQEMYSKQASIVEQIEELIQVQGGFCDKLNALQGDVKRKKQILRTEARATIEKWANRFSRGNLMWGFHTWKVQKARLHARAVILATTKAHLKNNAVRNYFNLWHSVVVSDKETLLNQNITVTNDEVRKQVFELKQIRDRKKKVLDQNTGDTQKLQKEIRALKIKSAKVVQQIIRVADQNHSMKWKKYMLISWYQYIQRRRKCCNILGHAIKMTLMQTTFTTVKNFSRDDEYTDRARKHTTKIYLLVKKHMHSRGFQAFKANMFFKVKAEQKQVFLETKELINAHRTVVSNVKTHHSNVQFKRTKSISLQLYFNRLRKVAFVNQMLRKASENTKDAMVTIARRKALLKWKARSDLTRKMRTVFTRSQVTLREVRIAQVFKSWKNEFLSDKFFIIKAIQIIASMMQDRQEYALSEIKRHARDRQRNLDRLRKMCIRMLSMSAKMGQELKIKNAWRIWKEKTDKARECVLKFQRLVMHHKLNEYRNYFFHWKYQAQKEACLVFNETEDGPTNCEVWNLKRKEKNLERFMREVDLQPQDVVETVKTKAQTHYQNLVEKSLCRLLCKQEGKNLYLLPACLDKWKRFNSVRRKWREVLKSMNNRASKTGCLHDKQWAFERLRYQHSDKVEALSKMPVEELQKRCIKNVDRLQDISDILDGSQGNMAEYKDQRNQLLKHYIASQKLAFSVTQHSYDRVKARALHNLAFEGHRQLRLKIETALAMNLKKISDLKDTIAGLENDNDITAVQNDLFREGAVDGIQLARQLDTLAQDREQLSCDLADKALTIRKLLEDNRFLTNKLSQTQRGQRTEEKLLNMTLDQQREMQVAQMRHEIGKHDQLLINNSKQIT